MSSEIVGMWGCHREFPCPLLILLNLMSQGVDMCVPCHVLVDYNKFKMCVVCKSIILLTAP